jgi:hypothetical protein
MKWMTRENFEYVLSKLTIGKTWTVQTMTEHGAPVVATSCNAPFITVVDDKGNKIGEFEV